MNIKIWTSKKSQSFKIIKKSINNGGVSMNNTGTMERPTTILQSLEESFKEVKLIREGKLSKKTWRQLREERKINKQAE